MEQKTLVIREWGRIHLGEENKFFDLDNVTLNAFSWNFLAERTNAQYIRFVKRNLLQIKGFVGVITTPDGTQIEILPKTSEDLSPEITYDSRATLEMMLRVVNNLKFTESTEAELRIKRQPLPEMLIFWFLQCVMRITQQGLRKDYNRIEAHEKFLKGQLQLGKQLREPPHKRHKFHIEYDIFSANRAENRLLHSALHRVSKYSQSNDNKKQAKHYLLQFDNVPFSSNFSNDFLKWSTQRDMHHYQAVLPWLRLILNQQSPFTLADRTSGISFLIPMESLFEKYVAKCISKQLPEGFYLTEQKPQKFLAEHDQKKVFLMKPDIVIHHGRNNPICILDTKWKRIDQAKTYENGDNDHKRGISQSDMYQLFAYGKKFNLNKVGLVYPKWSKFNKSFSFQFDDELKLGVEPFDLNLGIQFPLDFYIGRGVV